MNWNAIGALGQDSGIAPRRSSPVALIWRWQDANDSEIEGATAAIGTDPSRALTRSNLMSAQTNERLAGDSTSRSTVRWGR
jgi:hypothetical protein